MTFHVVFRLDESQDWEEDISFHERQEAEDYVSQVSKPPSKGTQGGLAQGEFAIWTDQEYSQYFGLEETDEVTDDLKTDKEVNMYIYETHIRLDKENTFPVLVFTSKPNPGELMLYNRLMELREDHHLIQAEKMLKQEFNLDFTFRIKNLGESYTIPFLVHHVHKDLGKDFRLEMLQLKERNPISKMVESLVTDKNEKLIIERIRKSTRAWGSSTSMNLLFIQGTTWDAYDQDLGMVTGNSRKQSKRENENARITELWLKTKDLKIHIPEREDGILDEEVDGQLVISTRCLRRMIKRIPNMYRRRQVFRQLKNGTSWNIRIMGPNGLWKGDAIHGPDKALEAKYGFVPDIVTDDINLKPEKGMAGQYLVTLNAHHPHHMPSISAQALSWGKEFFVTEERMKKDFTALTEEFKVAMEEGKYPAHLLNSGEMHEEGTLRTQVSESYKDALQDQTQRWLATGLTVQHTSHLVERLAHGFDMKLERMIDRGALPLAWATMAHATTDTMLRMAGYDLSEYDTSKMFWHNETGRMCWPGKVFAKNFHRHGGFDLDDTLITMLRIKEVDANDNPSMTFEIKGKTWCVKAVNLRSPNGLTYHGMNERPGEYSVEDIDLGVKIVQCGFLALPIINFPLYNVWHAMPMVDMARAPVVTHHQTVEHHEMPRDEYELGDKYSVEDAVRQFKLAMENPGIGSIINPLIAFSTMTGTYPESLPARLEEMVDALEQTPDLTAFKLIQEATKTIQTLMMYKHTESIDRFTAKTRLPKKVRLFLESKNRIEIGMMSRLITHMKAERLDLKKHLTSTKKGQLGIAITKRKVIPGMMDIEVSAEAKKVAVKVHQTWWAKKKGAPRQFQWVDSTTQQVKTDKDPYVSYARREYFIKLNNELVELVMANENWDEILVGLYQYTIDGNHPDNVLFQTGENNTLTGLMDYFIAAMFKRGIIDLAFVQGGLVRR